MTNHVHFLHALVVAGLLLACAVPGAHAAPYLPASDSTILVTLPAGSSALSALQQKHQAAPDDFLTAYLLADAYLKQGHQEGDPRDYGYAEALLKPLLAGQTEATKPDYFIAQANILQYRHDFDGALVILNNVLRAHPEYPGAHTMRAVVQLVRGHYAAAAPDCRAVLSPANGGLLGLTCLMLVEGMTGKLAPSYATLNNFYARFSATAAPAERSWALGTLGEMAQRLGDVPAAESYFRNALSENPKDYYALGALADVLLAAHQPDAVLALLREQTQQDQLLLRLALAEQAKGIDTKYAGLMRERIAAAKQRNDTAHLAQYARFTLAVEHNPRDAFAMAKENWQKQKEAADAQLLVDTALAAGDVTAAKAVRAWQREQGYEDVALQKGPAQ